MGLVEGNTEHKVVARTKDNIKRKLISHLYIYKIGSQLI